MRRIDLLVILFIVAIASCFLPNAYEAYAIARGEYISENAMSQRALFRYLERMQTQDVDKAYTSGVFVASGSTIYPTANINYCIDGVMYVKTATTTMEFSAAAQVVNTVNGHLLSYNSAGTGTSTALVGSAITIDTMPTPPTGYLPVAYVNITTNATDAFTLGTTSFSSASAVIVNISKFNPTAATNFQDL